MTMARNVPGRVGMLATGLVVVTLLAGCASRASAADSTGDSPTIGTITGTTATATTSQRTTTAPACQLSNVTVSLGPSANAAASTLAPLLFTNTGNTDCALAGFPAVSYTNSTGTPIGATSTNIGGSGARITLRPGDIASAMVNMADVSMLKPSLCQASTVAGFQVTLPDDTAPTFVSLPAGATGCAAGPSALSVRAIQPGSGS